jgi:hypothetical protein
MKTASTILAPTPSPRRLLTIHVGLESGLRTHTIKDETTSRHRKRSSTRVLKFQSPQFRNSAILPLSPRQGSKAYSFVVAETSHDGEWDTPPPYTNLLRTDYYQPL